MGVSTAPDAFQAKMNNLFNDLEYVCTYLDDLLILSSSTFKDHLDELGKVLQHFQDKGVRMNAPRSTFMTDKIDVHQQAFEYIKTMMAKISYGYIQTFPKSL